MTNACKNSGADRLTLDDLRRIPSISIEEAATVLGIGRTAAYAAARRGEIPTVRIGARIRVPSSRLLQMLDGVSVAEDTRRMA